LRDDGVLDGFDRVHRGRYRRFPDGAPEDDVDRPTVVAVSDHRLRGVGREHVEGVPQGVEDWAPVLVLGHGNPGVVGLVVLARGPFDAVENGLYLCVSRLDDPRRLLQPRAKRSDLLLGVAPDLAVVFDLVYHPFEHVDGLEDDVHHVR